MNFMVRGVADENCVRQASFAATLRDRTNFPGLVVTRRSKTPGIHRSSLLDTEKIGSRRRTP